MDAVSRFPGLEPKVLAPDGMREAFDILLAALSTNGMETQRSNMGQCSKRNRIHETNDHAMDFII